VPIVPDEPRAVRPSPRAEDFVDTVVGLTRRRVEVADPETAALVVSLMRAAGRHRGLFEERAHAEQGRHLRAFSVLYLVWIFDELTARDLGRSLGMSRQTTSAALAALESAGLVCRSRADQGDRRLVRVRLTEPGERAVAAQFRAQHRLDSRWLAVLTPGDRRLLRTLLDRVATSPVPGPSLVS